MRVFHGTTAVEWLGRQPICWCRSSSSPRKKKRSDVGKAADAHNEARSARPAKMISNLDALHAADIDSISRDEFRELKKAAEAELEAEMVILKAKIEAIEAIESKFRRVDGARSALNPGFSEGDQSLIAVRPRKRTCADVVSAHPPNTREVTFLDLPQDIKNQILGPANLPDPADGANLRAVSRGMRDAVDATGRELKELKIDQALDFGNVRAVRRLMLRGNVKKAYMCAAAAASGQLGLLKYLRAGGSKWDKDTCTYAAKGGHLETLKWARENHCVWNSETCDLAAKHGHLEVLKWARANDCPWDKWTCAYAAEGGHLEVLRWARENDCPWDERTCELAAEDGHLEILKWARENDCPWDKLTCTAAAKGGHLEILKWARENDCPWDEETRELAASKGYVES